MTLKDENKITDTFINGDRTTTLAIVTVMIDRIKAGDKRAEYPTLQYLRLAYRKFRFDNIQPFFRWYYRRHK